MRHTVYIIFLLHFIFLLILQGYQKKKSTCTQFPSGAHHPCAIPLFKKYAYRPALYINWQPEYKGGLIWVPDLHVMFTFTEMGQCGGQGRNHNGAERNVLWRTSRKYYCNKELDNKWFCEQCCKSPWCPLHGMHCKGYSWKENKDCLLHKVHMYCGFHIWKRSASSHALTGISPAGNSKEGGMGWGGHGVRGAWGEGGATLMGGGVVGNVVCKV